MDFYLGGQNKHGFEMRFHVSFLSSPHRRRHKDSNSFFLPTPITSFWVIHNEEPKTTGVVARQLISEQSPPTLQPGKRCTPTGVQMAFMSLCPKKEPFQLNVNQEVIPHAERDVSRD